MLINLRGTSGAGKSTVVRNLMAQCGRQPIYGALGLCLPEAYHLVLPQPAYVIGPYTTDCGGCDRILPFALVPQLIERYAQGGHVIFEGLLMSTCFGEVGRLLMARRDSRVMFLDTSLRVCIERVKARRAAAGNMRRLNSNLLAQKYATIARLKDKFGARAMWVRDHDAVATIMSLLSTNGDIDGHS
jgi:hypothetical protein